eukprot:7348802-Ditylum_brightwellii.AAC.1
MAQPQTNNFSSDFNERADAAAMLLIESLLSKRGYIFSFLACANDDVLCDSAFALSVLMKFLNGECSFSAHTDTNHNVKLSRHQNIGRNNVKTVGIYMIDTGLLKLAGIVQDMYRPKDFA